MPESPLSKDSINNRRRLPPVNYGESDDDDQAPKDDESWDETANPHNESFSPSSRLIECPKAQCFKKFRDLNALKYHLSYTHNDLKDVKPPNKKLKKKKKILIKRKFEANAKDAKHFEKKEIKKEGDVNTTKIKKEIKAEVNDASKLPLSKMFPVVNGSDFGPLDNLKSETGLKNSANYPAGFNSHYSVHGNNGNSQLLPLTSSTSSSSLSSNSPHFNQQAISAASSNMKGASALHHNINYLMSNQQQQPLNLENSKVRVQYQPPPAHGSSNHPNPPPPPHLLQNGGRSALPVAKELEARLSSFLRNGSNDLRMPGHQPPPMNLGSARDSLTNKTQSQHPVQLQRQRSSGGPVSPAYSDISDEELTTTTTNITTTSSNNHKSAASSGRGLPSSSNPHVRSSTQDEPRKTLPLTESARPTSSNLSLSMERKTDGTKPTTQTIGPPPQHLPPDLHGGSLVFPSHLPSGMPPGIPPGFPPHLMASLAASMGAAAAAGGHRFPSPLPPIPGLPGASTQNVKALDILQQHANQYIATSKLQELQERAGQSKGSAALTASAASSPSSIPNSTSSSMTNLLGLNSGNVATSSPPLLRHEHNHTHLHLGYPPGFPPPTGLPGATTVGPASASPSTASNAPQGSSLRGIAPPAGSIAVPGAPSPSHLPSPSPSFSPGKFWKIQFNQGNYLRNDDYYDMNI